MADEVLDVRGLTCPAPLVETRKKIKRMDVGKTVEVIGDHMPSKTEVPDAMKDLGHEVLEVTESDGAWHVTLKKAK